MDYDFEFLKLGIRELDENVSEAYHIVERIFEIIYNNGIDAATASKIAHEIFYEVLF